jgi:hypothetical protein
MQPTKHIASGDTDRPAGSPVVEQGPTRVKWVRAAVVALLSIFIILCVTSALQKSATWDETHYLGAGYFALKTHHFDLAETRLHPILWTVWHDLPLLAAAVPEKVWKAPDEILRGQEIIALRPDDAWLNACRFTLLPFALALGVFVFRWSRQLYGDFGGLLSLTFFCFCPNILAHAPLITPDLMFSCFAVLTVHRLWRLARAPGRGNLLWCGLALGLMLLSKYTALLFVAVLFVTDVVYRIASRQMRWRSVQGIWRGLRHWPVLLGIGFLLVWAGYGFQAGILVLPSGTTIPIFAAPYFQGAVFQYLQSRDTHAFFLMGMYSGTGWWFYYLVVCLIKLPVGILALALGLVLGRRWLGLRFHSDELYLAVPFLLMFIYLSCFNTIQNGFRYLLPVYPLLLVLIGKYGEVLHRKAVRVAVGLLTLWMVAGSIWIWPDYLAYFNELIGGPHQGYHWLGDSNLDWGQDLKGLRRFMAAHDIKRISLSYFGTADPAHYGINYAGLPSANSSLRPTPPLEKGELPPRFVALSATEYQAIAFADKNVYRFYYRYVPNYLIGCSILVYDLDALIPRTKTPLPLRIRGIAGHLAPMDSCP